MNDDLSKSFTEAQYVTPYGVIRIGSNPPQMCEEVMNQVGCTSLVILGAENPLGQQASQEKNDAEHGKLGADLAVLGFPFVESIGQCEDWSERHFLIFGMPSDDALKLAALYKQAAIVVSESGMPARLEWMEE